MGLRERFKIVHPSIGVSKTSMHDIEALAKSGFFSSAENCSPLGLHFAYDPREVFDCLLEGKRYTVIGRMWDVFFLHCGSGRVVAFSDDASVEFVNSSVGEYIFSKCGI